MTFTAIDLAELSTINLHFAFAELTTIGDRESILRALDHIRQAQAWMDIAVAENRTPPAEAEVEAG